MRGEGIIKQVAVYLKENGEQHGSNSSSGRCPGGGKRRP